MLDCLHDALYADASYAFGLVELAASVTGTGLAWHLFADYL